ncbi:hypothetical protein GPECTOR_21g683 [Gonium pectorale]|uniref:Uncharacterized protein n=1 Tax=Gonium pectorale TaxID=33097 RepID=A0A150GI15_GONPE|nr:hypothetical protein GPECTOR_21g683 [Gonium pectorale]|eukprot:KXZ49457.1 hypothetical protein GPECTOR_21g683 [Gonium pectorale]
MLAAAAPRAQGVYAFVRAVSGGPAGGRLIDGVVDRVLDRFTRGEFDPKVGPIDSSAGGHGEAGGGGGAASSPRSGSGAVTYDYDAVPRSIDVDAFRRALSAALTESAGAGGGGAGGTAGGHLAQKLMRASPSERQAIVEETTKKVSEEEVSRLLAEEPIGVVRSRLASMLERSGY